MRAHPEQRQRLYAKLCRELGPSALEALADPDVTEVMCNPDGAVWIESHGQGMREIGDRLNEVQVESLIGTVAALLGTVVHGRAPIVEGELPVNGHRFEGILPPVSTADRKSTRLNSSHDQISYAVFCLKKKKKKMDKFPSPCWAVT